MEFIRTVDEALFFWINNGWSSPAMDGIMAFVTIAGDAGVWILFGLLAIFLWDRENWKRRAATFLLTMGVAGLALVSAKAVFDRERPMERFKEQIRSGDVVIHTPVRKLFARSFPSGHSQAAFTAATFFALYYRRYRLFLFGAASMVALSRVYLGAHFPADIIVGSFMGWAVAWLVWLADPQGLGKKSVRKTGIARNQP